MKLNDEDRALLTADEIASIEASEVAAATEADEAAAAAAAAQDTTAGAAGDDTVEAAAGADTAPGAAVDDPLTADELAAALAEAGTTAPPEAPRAFTVADTDFAEQRKALKDERKGIETKWAAGEMTDDERAEALEGVADKLEAIISSEAKAAALREINEQNAAAAKAKAEAEMDSATMALLKSSKIVDYAKDARAQRQFDGALSLLLGDPDMAGKTAAQIVDQAHKTVLALRGLTETPKPDPKIDPKPAARPREVPVTLTGMPAAGAADMGDDVMAQFELLEGPDAQEAFLAGLPEHQQKRLMRLADRRTQH